MIRILLFIIGIIAAALVFGWLADRPGAITVEWMGYEIKTSAFVGALAPLVAALILAWTLLRYLLTRPAAMSAYMQEPPPHSFDALTRGLLAIGVGDRSQAQRYASVARRNLPNEPLTALLKAQAAQLKGDRASARRTFQAMLDRPETNFSACGACSSKLSAATTTTPPVRSPSRPCAPIREPAGASTRCSTCRPAPATGEGALATLAVARKHGNIEAEIALRRRAVLLTAGRDLGSSQPDKALALANEALRLSASLIPAAEIAGSCSPRRARRGLRAASSRAPGSLRRIRILPPSMPSPSPADRRASGPSRSSSTSEPRTGDIEQVAIADVPSRRATGQRRKRLSPYLLTGRQRESAL